MDDFLERNYFDKGYTSVIGVDEVGRGSWAGPVVVGAFVYTSSMQVLRFVNDSKRVTKKRREALFPQLTLNSFSLGSATSVEIDELNIGKALILAIERALSVLDLDKSIVLFDGRFTQSFPFEYQTIIDGDALHYSIAAASIIAKVYRDRIMRDYAGIYPKYGFERHAGYGTEFHKEALEQYGVCPLHRRSYKPIQKILSTSST